MGQMQEPGAACFDREKALEGVDKRRSRGFCPRRQDGYIAKPIRRPVLVAALEQIGARGGA